MARLRVQGRLNEYLAKQRDIPYTLSMLDYINGKSEE
jgi:hypothetical protein